jgi:hypothetical protein
MIIIETPIFTRRIQSILADDEYRLLQAQLVQKPDAGKIIPGSGGLRNFAGLRVAMESVVASGLSIIGLYHRRSS